MKTSIELHYWRERDKLWYSVRDPSTKRNFVETGHIKSTYSWIYRDLMCKSKKVVVVNIVLTVCTYTVQCTVYTYMCILFNPMRH